ncbi:protein co-occurring with transport systems [Halarchaeum acidiphilum MH1-52-1]|uniref:Protein co-occurring with transport systems n=1 Tax=Halarchaeum acidiphilum MH1-52-1 TaxID=1261545 RepID=U2YRE4_9EURY|nr:YigZ family protein [Halarchaeum acidiphilum]GAD51287.1 protein co-occurring with transport systems [Halarchaeum acidiphilum MH1-52-1]
MADETYDTLAGPGEARFEIRGSEFVGRARPVETVADAEAFVDEVQARYADASHNVPCYRVRVESGTGRSHGGHLLREYQSDDGEPSGSSGKPALNVLQQRDVENAVVVVTRYFGGTELGVGGLARAYSRATKEAIDDADVVTRKPRTAFDATVDYDDSGTIRGILESADCEFEATYEERVSFAVSCARDDAPDLKERLRNATSGRVEIE